METQDDCRDGWCSFSNRTLELMERRAPARTPFPVFAPLARQRVYCNSFSTSCWTLLAWAKAEMPVWLRISYFDMLELACA